MPHRLVTLVILDGWGIAPPGPGNAVELATTPVFDRLWAECPHTTLEASGEACSDFTNACASCAISGVAVFPVPIAHTGSYAMTSRSCTGMTPT